jgi:hypothetical protein
LKKYFLSISVLICFWFSFAAAADHKTVVASDDIEWNQFSVASLGYPHTDLEIVHHITRVNSTVRQQSLPGFIGAVEPIFPVELCSTTGNNDLSSTCASKQYLSHIYPSHNFW